MGEEKGIKTVPGILRLPAKSWILLGFFRTVFPPWKNPWIYLGCQIYLGYLFGLGAPECTPLVMPILLEHQIWKPPYHTIHTIEYPFCIVHHVLMLWCHGPYNKEITVWLLLAKVSSKRNSWCFNANGMLGCVPMSIWMCLTFVLDRQNNPASRRQECREKMWLETDRYETMTSHCCRVGPMFGNFFYPSFDIKVCVFYEKAVSTAPGPSSWK